jgi:hypothetical protein
VIVSLFLDYWIFRNSQKPHPWNHFESFIFVFTQHFDVCFAINFVIVIELCCTIVCRSQVVVTCRCHKTGFPYRFKPLHAVKKKQLCSLKFIRKGVLLTFFLFVCFLSSNRLSLDNNYSLQFVWWRHRSLDAISFRISRRKWDLYVNPRSIW